VHRGLFGAGARAVDAGVVGEHLGVLVLAGALVGRDQPSGTGVPDLAVVEVLDVLLGVRVGVGLLLRDPLVEGLAGIYEWETKRYIGYSRAWRDIRKPTIAAVQGQCIAGGLLLCWPMDIIIAADNAKFSDPVVRMGIGGVEYHGHTWELGPRKAKEWLFTASQFTAVEAEKFGMVNHVVPLDELREFTMAMAGRIAGMNAFALAQAKRAVNQTQDVQGFYAAIQSVFDIHSTGHGHALSVNGYPILVDLDQMKQSMKEG